MSVRTIDPKQTLVLIGGVAMSGFADGTFIEIVSDAQQFTKVVGADGYTTRVKTNNYNATLTLTLAQSSPSNDVLSGFLALDKAANAGVVPVLIKDMTGNTLIFSSTSWIQQFPDITYSNEMTERAWTIELVDLDVVVGSNGVSQE